MKQKHKNWIITLSVILVLGIITAMIVINWEPDAIDAEYIKQQCMEKDYESLHTKVQVEFFDFETPAQSGKEKIYHYFRFENITDKPFKLNFKVYYNKKLDAHIIARMGLLMSDQDSLVIESHKGYRVVSYLTLLYPKEKYSEKQLQEIAALSALLYVEMELDQEKFYFILDCENEKVITKLSAPA